MRHTSRKRQSPDPLAPVDAPTWLVVRDRVGRVLECTELVPKADLRAVLIVAREERIASGWTAERIGAVCAFFFASRNGERVLVGIEHVPPTQSALGETPAPVRHAAPPATVAPGNAPMAAKKKAQASPAFVTPMAAVAVKQLPEGLEWLYEVKWDGYRALVIKDGSRLQIQSRNHKALTGMYPGVAAAALKLAAEQAVLDGEIVALDESGRPAFQALQHRGAHAKHRIVLYAFDVLHVDGRDMTGEPIEKRRALLPKIVGDSPVIRVSDGLPGSAAQVIEAVRSLGLEGVIAKRRGSRYQSGERSSDWLKLKLENQQEFVIGGFRPDGRTSIDALVVGYFEDEHLKFAGKVRAGFTPHIRDHLRRHLEPLRTEECAFSDLPTGRSRWGGGITAEEMREFVWTRPELIAQIRFVEWTAEGRLRHAAFLGLRTDKPASAVRHEL